MEDCANHIVKLLTDYCVSVKMPDPSETFIFKVMNIEKRSEFKHLIREHFLAHSNESYIDIIYHELGGILLIYISSRIREDVLERITFN